MIETRLKPARTYDAFHTRKLAKASRLGAGTITSHEIYEFKTMQQPRFDIAVYSAPRSRTGRLLK